MDFQNKLDPFLQKENNNISQILKVHESPFISINYNNTTLNLANYEEVKINEFYKQKFNNSDFLENGRFLENDREIILSEDLAEKLNIDDPIGKEVILNIGNEAVNLKIVAINKIKSFVSGQYKKQSGETQNIIYSYLSWNLLEEYALKKSKELTNYKIEEEKIKGNLSSISKFFVIEKASFLIENEKLISGKTPEAIDEILISSSLKNKLKEAKDIKYLLSLVRDLKDSSNTEIELKYSGVFESDRDEIKIKKELDDLLKKPNYRSASVYLKDHRHVDEFENQLKNVLPNWLLSDFSKAFNSILPQNSLSFRLAIFAISAITVISFLIQLIFSSKLIINSKSRQIAILKSFKVSFKQILFYHWVNIALIGLISLIITLVLYVPISTIIDISLVPNFSISTNYSIVFGYMILIWFVALTISSLLYLSISYLSFKRSVTKTLKETLT